MLPYLACMIVFLIGLYGIIAKKNIIKIIVGVAAIEYAVNAFLVLLSYRSGGTVPIRPTGVTAEEFAAAGVDPIPQALILTSIVIGLAVLVLMVAVAVRLHDRYGTFDVEQINELRG
jgi:multicomponent Na+:H+ antiporter subunit C